MAPVVPLEDLDLWVVSGSGGIVSQGKSLRLVSLNLNDLIRGFLRSVHNKAVISLTFI